MRWLEMHAGAVSATKDHSRIADSIGLAPELAA
jgi:hypothetical protein